MTTKVWNLKYVAGNTNRVISEASNPQSRKAAIEGANVVSRNGWRVWIEHYQTGKRLYENELEKAHQADLPESANTEGQPGTRSPFEP
jgi:hypothetical protein